MIISLGFIRSANQVLIREINWITEAVESKIIDATDLSDQNLQGLFVQDNEHFQSLVNLLEKEKAFYPILNATEEELSLTLFEAMTPQALKDTYLKILNRWTLHQNFNSIENMWKITNHFRDLWKKDRISFFEEFWYWLRRNLGTIDLTIVFNDVISTEEKDENNEKKDRPKLTQALLSGAKKANFLQGTLKEKELMQTYTDKFHDSFEVTEFNFTKGQFVATAQIERSPIILMARTTQLNQLQRAVLTSFFNGMH